MAAARLGEGEGAPWLFRAISDADGHIEEHCAAVGIRLEPAVDTPDSPLLVAAADEPHRIDLAR